MVAHSFRLFSQVPDFIHPLPAEIHERSSKQLRVLNGARMRLRGVDIRVHDFKVALRHVSRRRSRRDQMRPGIPVIEERFDLDVWTKVQ
jgi:hypothetical protein